MLTINRIREHWQAVEVERLRREVKEMQARLEVLQSELRQPRRLPLSWEPEGLLCGSEKPAP